MMLGVLALGGRRAASGDSSDDDVRHYTNIVTGPPPT